MCTLIAAVDPDRRRRLLVAANRDESLHRPAESPAPRKLAGTSVFSPLDRKRGGTWMGLSQAGLFVGLTNRFGVPVDPSRRSRGAVVTEALGLGSVASARAWAHALVAEQENGFHLIAVDGTDALLVVATGRDIRIESLGTGIHILTERAFGAALSGRQESLDRRFHHLRPADLEHRALAELLRSHGNGAFDSVCVHATPYGVKPAPDAPAYGTRSSAIIEMYRDRRRVPRWWGTDGPPCRNPLTERAVYFP